MSREADIERINAKAPGAIEKARKALKSLGSKKTVTCEACSTKGVRKRTVVIAGQTINIGLCPATRWMDHDGNVSNDIKCGPAQFIACAICLTTGLQPASKAADAILDELARELEWSPAELGQE